MNEPKDTETAVNDARTQAGIGTELTHARSGFDPVNVRRGLIAKRVSAGAETPIGHRCSNLVELLDNYGKSDGKQREHIEANIRKQMADLAIRHQ